MIRKELFGLSIEKELQNVANIKYADLRLRAIKKSILEDPSDAINYFKEYLTCKLPKKHTLSADISFDDTFVTWSYNVDSSITQDGHTLQVMDTKIIRIVKLYVSNISDDYELSVEQLKILVDITEKYWYRQGKDEITNKIKEFNEIFNPTRTERCMPY